MIDSDTERRLYKDGKNKESIEPLKELFRAVWTKEELENIKDSLESSIVEGHEDCDNSKTYEVLNKVKTLLEIIE